MAYVKTEWKDRLVEKPFTYTSVENPDGTITLTPQMGNIYEVGTPVNAINMNKLESAVQSIAGEVDGIKGGIVTVPKSAHATNSDKSSKADFLTNSRTISINGAVNGSVSFNGASNVTLTTKVNKGTSNPSGGADGDVYYQYN